MQLPEDDRIAYALSRLRVDYKERRRAKANGEVPLWKMLWWAVKGVIGLLALLLAVVVLCAALFFHGAYRLIVDSCRRVLALSLRLVVSERP